MYYVCLFLKVLGKLLSLLLFAAVFSSQGNRKKCLRPNRHFAFFCFKRFRFTGYI